MSSIGSKNRLEPFFVSSWRPHSNQPVRYGHSELGYFSIDEERHFLSNKCKLGTLQLPRDSDSLDIDLNVGFEQWRELPNVQQHLDSMLQWILLNKKLLTRTGDFRSSKDGARLDVDFVTSRGNLARILDIQNGKDGKGRKWTLLATRYRGTVYLSHIEDNRDEEMSSFARRICYWGKRFEVEVTAPPGQDSLLGYSRGNEEERYGPMKAYPGFFSVVRFQLEGHKIVLRAEIDAQTQVLDELQIPDYVELKVATETIVRAPWAFKRKRLVPWWCQSIVSGTPLIVYGIRDYDGHVKRIRQVRTDEIPDHVGHENLDKERCLLFLSDVLSWMKDIVLEEDVTEVYAFQWDPNTPANSVTVNVLRDAEGGFLPDWYFNEMEDYFASLNHQRRSKGQKRKMEDGRQDLDRNGGIKDMRKQLEESWPRSADSGKSKPQEKLHRGESSQPRSRRFYDDSDRDRARATHVFHDAPHKGHRPQRELSQRGEFERQLPLRHTSSAAYGNDTGRSVGTETQLEFGKTSTRGDHRPSSRQFHKSDREQTENSRRCERHRREGEDQRPPRARSVTSPCIETRSRRLGDKSHPFADAERISEQSRVKRAKRDPHNRGFRRF